MNEPADASRRAFMAGAAALGVGITMPMAFASHTASLSNLSNTLRASLAIHSGTDADRAWLLDNVPLLDCPDESMLAVYYFRWRSYRHSLRLTPVGWVVWEFPFVVGWAGIYNTIGAAAGHHIYEGRWLRDRRYMDDYIAFWTNHPKAPLRNYSFWAADAVWARYLATGDGDDVARCLQPLIHNYRHWEEVNRGAGPLYFQLAVNDGMEEQVGGEGGFRPTLNSYQYGDARAIAAMARLLRIPELAISYERRAQAIKQAVESLLWHPEQQFFETRDALADRLVNVRELHGYTPWYFNLPGPQFAVAWRQLFDVQGFAAPYGPTTVERRSDRFRLVEDDSRWDGSSWPFATTQTLVAMANLLNASAPAPVTKHHYYSLLDTYTRTQFRRDGQDDATWIGESVQPLTGQWTSSVAGYNHSAYADLIITGLIGLRPRADDVLEVHSLLPEGVWTYFAMLDVPYHGRSISVIYDRDGSRYGLGKGLSLFVDGVQVVRSERLQRLTALVHPHRVQMLTATSKIIDAPGARPVDRVTATASFWRATHDPSNVLLGYDLDLYWSSYESGFATDWLQLNFPSPVTLCGLEVDFYEDEDKHRPPMAYHVHHWTGSAWTELREQAKVPPQPAARTNVVRFAATSVDRLRIVVVNAKPGRRGLGTAVTQVRWLSA